MPSDTARQTRVYLVDDHDLVRRGLRDLLAAARDIVVVGESSSAQNAPASILKSDADVMLLDLQLSDGSGVEVCRRVRAARASVKGILLTAADDEQAALAAVLAGAAGYAIKAAANMDLVGTVRAVAAGKDLIDAGFRREVESFLVEAGSPRSSLSEQDRRVLSLVAAGRTDREIADAVGEPLDAVARQVADLVLRRTGLAAAQDEPGPTGPQPGKHRRTAG